MVDATPQHKRHNESGHAVLLITVLSICLSTLSLLGLWFTVVAETKHHLIQTTDINKRSQWIYRTSGQNTQGHGEEINRHIVIGDEAYQQCFTASHLVESFKSVAPAVMLGVARSVLCCSDVMVYLRTLPHHCSKMKISREWSKNFKLKTSA